MKTAMLDLKGKRVLVMGLGLHGGGIGTVKFLAGSGAKLTVTDLRPPKILKPALRELAKIKNISGEQDQTIRYVLGRHQKEDFIKSDLIVKNPGVKPDSPFLKIAKKSGVPITSDLGIFFKHCPGKIISVTGTRGKSTTAYLIWQFLQEKFRSLNSPGASPAFSSRARLFRSAGCPRVFLGGNIRKSVLEFLPKVKENDWVVLELSSFQLHDLAQEKQSPAPNFDCCNRSHPVGEEHHHPIKTSSRQLNQGSQRNGRNFGDGASPAIAVITNIFPDHLNWHKNFADYLKAKSNIFAFQKTGDFLFVAKNDNFIRRFTKNAVSQIILADLPEKLEKIADQNLGEHYRNSAALAVAIAKHFRVGEATIQKILKNFKGLEGRQELIATLKGVRWINDTTATIPEATIAALQRFTKNTRGRLVLIAGGQDKNLDFRKMVKDIKKKVAELILLPGTATEKLKKYLLPPKNGLKIREVKSMSEAVKKAAALARHGDLVILSPGAASFGLFANEFDRGKQFTNEIHKLQRSNS